MANMKHSKNGLELTQRFEQCRRTAYWDALGGVWTIGWGSTGPDIVEGTVWTQDQCDARLLSRYQKAEDNVNRHVTVDITQGMFDALVDFDYNCGDGALDSSTLLKLVNARDKEHAAKEFEKWDHAGGKVVAGLLRRRLAEEQEFNS